MSKTKSYNTKQKELIIDVIKQQNNEFTIKDIHNSLKGKVGLTTIYRLVDKMVNENKLNKTITKDNITIYQYLKECENKNHFYLKCDVCGSLIHIDCECINDLTTHIFKKHNFKPNKDHIIFNGICQKCNK